VNSNIEPSSVPIACHGKLPVDREYVHLQVGDIVVDELDQWVRDAHRHAFLRPKSPTDGYDRAPAFGFVFESESGHHLHGILAPSRDSTGRRYPFWTAWPAPGPDVSAELFASQHRFVTQVVRGDLSFDSLQRKPSPTRPSPTRPSPTRPSPSRISSRARAQTERDAPSGFLFGKDFLNDSLPPGCPLTPSQFLAAWINVFDGKTTKEVLRFNYGLQIPLPVTGSTTRSAALWIDATRRINRRSRFPISAFWSLRHRATPEEADGDDASLTDASENSSSHFLLLFFGPPPIAAYGHLFEPSRDRSFLYNPSTLDPKQAASILGSLSAEHRQMIEALETKPSVLELLN